MTLEADERVPGRGTRLLLGLAAVAVAFAAADTYVVVLALPDMMRGVGLGVDELQRAAPIVSGFLLGYVAMLPLIGRIADLRGRVPVLVGSLVVFALGSLVTAASYDLPSMVAGRFLQGVGGGGLVPATLALVADLYPPARRGVPLGMVGAVQELGSVLGPLYGALVLAFAGWEEIFWLNLAVGLVLAAALRAAAGAPVHAGGADPARPRRRGAGRARSRRALPGAAGAGVAHQRRHARPGVPARRRESRWLTPVALALYLLLGALVARCLTAAHPLLDLRRWREVAGQADLPGAGLLACSLGGVILAFATADPEVQVLSPAGPGYLLASALAAAGFVWRTRAPRTRWCAALTATPRGGR